MSRKLILGLIILTSFVFLLTTNYTISAAGPPPVRYATCDACGLCPIITNNNGNITDPSGSCTIPVTPAPPGNWKQCIRCLYPSLYPTNAVPEPADCYSLKINPLSHKAPTVVPGRQYTAIGCITSEGGFQNNRNSGAASFTQALFDLIVFRMIGGIALLYFMYGAFLIITSQSDPEKLNHGKRVLYGSIIGLVFVLTSVLLVNIIGSNILKIPGFISQ